MKPTRLLLATTNQGKVAEVRAVLEGLGVDLVSLAEFPSLPEAVENADTFEDNAKLKALHYAKLTGLVALADDSGLEVDVLHGAPGVRSARYAGPTCDDAANNAKLVADLADIPAERRTARFRCALALVSDDDVIHVAAGVIEGLIIDEPRGTNGFGYDPHFLVPEFGLTTAEMPPAHKNEISHRGRALRAIRPAIERIFRVERVASGDE